MFMVYVGIVPAGIDSAVFIHLSVYFLNIHPADFQATRAGAFFHMGFQG